MTEDEFQKLYPALSGWINETLSRHAKEAEKGGALKFPRLSKYFKLSTLQDAKVVRLPLVPVPPFQQLGLRKFSDLMPKDLGGITYRDTFFIKMTESSIKGTESRDEATHFHELVHIVQWRQLGEEAFLFRYANELEECGYDNSPLEKMAYSMQDRFEQQQEQLFDAEALIIKQLAP